VKGILKKDEPSLKIEGSSRREEQRKNVLRGREVRKGLYSTLMPPVRPKDGGIEGRSQTLQRKKTQGRYYCISPCQIRTKKKSACQRARKLGASHQGKNWKVLSLHGCREKIGHPDWNRRLRLKVDSRRGRRSSDVRRKNPGASPEESLRKKSKKESKKSKKKGPGFLGVSLDRFLKTRVLVGVKKEVELRGKVTHLTFFL